MRHPASPALAGNLHYETVVARWIDCLSETAQAAIDGDPLQRYYRDVMMATRNAMVDLDGTAEMEGRTLLGVAPWQARLARGLQHNNFTVTCDN